MAIDPMRNFMAGVQGVGQIHQMRDNLLESEYRRDRRKVLDQREDEQYRRNKLIQNIQLGEMAMRAEALPQQLAHEAWQRSRAMTEAEQADELHDIRIQDAGLANRLKEAQLSGQMTQNQANQLKLKAAQDLSQRQERLKSLHMIGMKFDAGDRLGAKQDFTAFAEDTGLDLPNLTANNIDRMDRTLTNILNADSPDDYTSADAQWMAQQLMTPALKASGRDPNAYTIKGFRELEDGRLAVAMTRTSDGGEAVATALQSTDPNDVVQTFTPEEIADRAAQWAELAELNTALDDEQFAAQYRFAREAVSPTPPTEPLTPEQQLARDKFEAEQVEAKKERFIAGFETDPGLQGLASVLVDQEGFDINNTEAAVDHLLAVEQTMSENEEMLPLQAHKLVLVEQEMAGIKTGAMSAYAAQYPDLTPEQIEDVAMADIRGNKDPKALAQHYQSQHDRRAARAQKRAEKKAAQDAPRTRGQRSNAAKAFEGVMNDLQTLFPETDEADLQSMARQIVNGTMTEDEAKQSLANTPVY